VQFVAVPGTRGRKATLIADMRSGTMLVLNDIVGNIYDASGFSGWLLHIVGFAGTEAQVPKVMKAGVIKDTNALRAQLLQWSEIESLKRILCRTAHRSRTIRGKRSATWRNRLGTVRKSELPSC
jgi:hypothetical protein